jgi:hypothetical protein
MRNMGSPRLSSPSQQITTLNAKTTKDQEEVYYGGSVQNGIEQMSTMEYP